MNSVHTACSKIWLLSGTLLAMIVATPGCAAPPIYGYLGYDPSASDTQLQAAWDARFPPGTPSADLVEQIQLEGTKYAADRYIGWTIAENDSAGVFITSSGWSPTSFPGLAAVSIAVEVDSNGQIVESNLYSHVLGP